MDKDKLASIRRMMKIAMEEAMADDSYEDEMEMPEMDMEYDMEDEEYMKNGMPEMGMEDEYEDEEYMKNGMPEMGMEDEYEDEYEDEEDKKKKSGITIVSMRRKRK